MMSIPPDMHTGPYAGRSAINIWLLVLPNFMLLDATGPIQVFSTANDEARDAGRAPPNRIHLVAAGGGQLVSSSGVRSGPNENALLIFVTLIVCFGSVAALHW